MQFHRINPLLVSVLPILVASECFYPDGKNATGLFPCYPDADVSHCCRKSDVCLSNGLCFSSGLGTIVRRGCTEPSWKSDSCPAVCDIEGFRAGDATLTPCGIYNSFCCGQDQAARDCCNVGNTTLAAQVPGGEPMCEGPHGEDESATSPSPITSNSAPTPTGLVPASSLKSIKTTRDAMIGLTAAFGVGLLAVAALANYWRRQKNQEERLRQDLQLQNTTLQQEKADMEMRLNLPKPFRDALDTTRLSRRDA